MSDYQLDIYKTVKLNFIPKENSPIQFKAGECFLELGLKGQFQSMQGLRSQKTMAEPTQPALLGTFGKSERGSFLGTQMTGDMQTFQEAEKFKRDLKTAQRNHSKEIADKNFKINKLQTELENSQTDCIYFQKQLKIVREQKDKIERELSTTKMDCEELKRQTEQQKKENTKLKSA